MKKKNDLVTPRKGMRFYFPKDFEQETDFQRYVILHKELNWSDYLKIRVPEENLTMRIYIPHFAVIFGRNEIKLHVAGKEEPVMLSTRPLLNKFQEGYIRGLKYFEENYKVSPEILYGANWQMYERTLHRHYYHPAEGSVVGEWVRYEKTYPIVFDFEQIAVYGYYSALISSIKELRKKHPIVFEKFDYCNKNPENGQKNEKENGQKNEKENAPEIEQKHQLKTTKVHTDPIFERIISKLKPFSGYWNSDKIMTNADFDELLNNVKYLIKNKKLPETIKLIPQCSVSNQFIMKTFSELNKEFYGKRRQKLFYDLIKMSFAQFKETSIDAIDTNFTTYAHIYSKDLELITYDNSENQG